MVPVTSAVEGAHACECVLLLRARMAVAALAMRRKRLQRLYTVFSTGVVPLEKRVALLRKLPVFAGCTVPERLQLARLMRLRLLGRYTKLLRAGVASFAFLCAVLYLAWEFQIGPVPAAVGAKLNSEAAFVLIGAASMSVWLACSMLVPHSQLGDKVLAAPSLHGCITAVGAGMALFDLSAGASTAVFVLAGCTGVLASHFSGSFPKSLVWNL